MPGFLRQATAGQARALGPFISSTDFVTPMTALTIANTDIKLVANGAASANKNSGGGTHRVNGEYGATFDATDTATVGELDVSVVVATALPVFDKFFVVEEAVYDALFAAAAPGYGVAQSGDSYPKIDTEIAAIIATLAGLSPLDAAGIRAAVGLTTANLDTQLDALPTAAELATALGTADDAVLAAVAAVSSAITALNNLSSVQAQTAVAAALTAYGVATGTQASAAGTLTTGERTAIITELMDQESSIEAGMTFRHAMRLIAAGAGGKTSGMETATVLLRAAVSDSKVRVTATTDIAGNRSAVTTDLT